MADEHDTARSTKRRIARHRNAGLRKVCGCPRKRWHTCEHPFYFNFRWDGEDYRFTLERQVGRVVRRATANGRTVWVRDMAALGDRLQGKTEATTEANRLRAAIQGKTLQAGGGSVLAKLTVAQLLNTYKERYVEVQRNDALDHVTYQIGTVTRVEIDRPDGARQAFGDWLVTDVTTDTIERFREARHTRSTRTIKKGDKELTRLAGGVIAANRDLAFLRAAFNWAIRTKHIKETPFKLGTEAVVKLAEETSRTRRLEEGEEERLLPACGSHLRALVEAALATGCRKGELLSLQWGQVRWKPKAEIVLPAQKTKTKTERRIPISSRLKLILDMRAAVLRKAHDLKDDEPVPVADYVFGSDLGTRVTSLKTSWRLALKRANITDLHFHDLRREAGSRWLDGGVPLQTVKTWLGHSNVSQTSTYLASTVEGQHEQMQRFESRQSTPASSSSNQPPATSTAAAETTTQETRH